MEEFLGQHYSWIIFFGAFIFGETVIIPAAALAAQGHFGVFALAGWGYAGTFVSDAIWFLLASPVGRFLERSEKSRAKYKTLVGWVSRRFGGRPERALLFVKFIYGARIATITLLSLGGVSLRRFLALNSVGTAVWIVVMVTVGWLAGRGVGIVASGLSRIEYALPLFLILTLALKKVVTSKQARDRKITAPPPD